MNLLCGKKKSYPNPWRYNGASVFSGDLMLGTFTVLCITLPISRTERQYIGTKVFWQKRKPRSNDKTENGEELHLKATGATTMDLVQSLNRMLKNTEKNPLGELY